MSKSPESACSVRLAIKGFAIVAVAVAVCLLLRPGLGRIFRSIGIRESLAIPLPRDAGAVRFTRMRKDFMPPDVVYAREVVYCSSEGEHKPWALPINPGYGTYINVYWISESEKSFVRLDEALFEYLLDLQSNRLNLIFPVKGKSYVGRLDAEDATLRWTQCADDPSTLVVYVGRHSAIPLEELVSDPTGEYLGAISGPAGGLKFVSAEDRAERAVEKLFSDAE